MRMKLRIMNCELRMPPKPAAGRPEADSSSEIRHAKSAPGFTLIEVLVAATLLALIVIALMAVFNGTQQAFRAGLTQGDVLESGRATMDLLVADLKEMSPSLDVSNGAVNFSAYVSSSYLPQSLVPANQARTNVLENFFILSRGNQNGVPTWYGTGYAVCLSPTNLYSLYRFSSNCPVAAPGAPDILFNSFSNSLPLPSSAGLLSAPPSGSTNGWSHLVDGVVELRVRAFDANSVWMNSDDPNNAYTNADNVKFLPDGQGSESEVGEQGILHVQQHAAGVGGN